MNLFIIIGVALTGFGIFQEVSKKKVKAQAVPAPKEEKPTTVQTAENAFKPVIPNKTDENAS